MPESSGNPNNSKSQFGAWSSTAGCSAERHVWRRHTNLPSISQQRQCQVCGENSIRKVLK